MKKSFRFMVDANESRIRNAILNQARRDKDIVFGARSIQKSIDLFSRKTKDYDIFTKNSKKSATKLEQKLDRILKRDFYYVKKGKNVGTWKIKSKGIDMRKGTKDDVSIVDFTKMPKPRPRSFKVKGVRFRKLREEVAAKKKAIADKKFKFRHKKDKDDLRRIEFARDRNLILRS